MVSTMPSASFRLCAPPQRRFDALATNAGAISGLAQPTAVLAHTLYLYSAIKYWGGSWISGVKQPKIS